MMYIKKLLGTEFLSILVDLPRQYPSVMRKNQQFSTFLQRSILRLFVRTAKKGRDENQLQTKLSILRLSALIVLPSGIRKLPAALSTFFMLTLTRRHCQRTPLRVVPFPEIFVCKAPSLLSSFDRFAHPTIAASRRSQTQNRVPERRKDTQCQSVHAPETPCTQEQYQKLTQCRSTHS
jgi:hypothetical protein